MKAFLSLFVLPLAAATLVPPAGVIYEQPQLAIGSNFAAVTFAGTGGRIWYASTRDRAKTFSTPIEVSAPAGLLAGAHRGPRIVITPRAIVVSAITAPYKGGTGNLIAWRSTDEGRTWSQPITINDTPMAAQEGLHAMAAAPDGRLYAVWLDDRTKGKRLELATSDDDGKTWSANREIYSSPAGTICECCHPQIIVSDEGTIFATFRNWLNGSRDLYLATSRDRGQTFKVEKLGQGTWKLDACPMDGGGIDTAGRTVNVVFRRSNKIYIVEPGEPEVELGDGKNPATAGPTVLWQTPTGLVIQSNESKPTILDPKGTYPTAIHRDNLTLIAWQSEGKIELRAGH